MTGESNDGRSPDDSAVLVPYPAEDRQPASDRQTWPWLAGTIEQQCGHGEWLVTIEDRRVAELEDGSPAPEGTPDSGPLFPQCYRDSSNSAPSRSLAWRPDSERLASRTEQLPLREMPAFTQ